jgi:hypothetical protein
VRPLAPSIAATERCRKENVPVINPLEPNEEFDEKHCAEVFEDLGAT